MKLTMKKISLLLAAVILCGIKVFAQIPFVEKGKAWQQVWFSQAHSAADFEEPLIYSYYIPEDETITADGKEYVPLYSVNFFSDKELVAYLREDNGKVFCLDMAANQECLVYDFTLNKGDYCRIYSIAEKHWADCEVTEVKTRYINGTPHKEIHINATAKEFDGMSQWNENVPNVWVEGIGSMTLHNGSSSSDCESPNSPAFNINLNMNVGASTPYYAFVCSKAGYTAFDIDEQHFHGRDINIVKELEAGTPLYEDFMKAGKGISMKYEFEGDKLIASGLMLANSPFNYVFCHDNSDKEIKLSYINAGSADNESKVYEVTFEIPGFQAGTYFIHDSEGMHEVHNLTDETGLRNIEAESGKMVPQMYDLTGRRLMAVPGKGLYIMNGKKRFVR